MKKNKKNLLCIGKSSLKVKVATFVIRILEHNLEAPNKDSIQMCGAVLGWLGAIFLLEHCSLFNKRIAYTVRALLKPELQFPSAV